MKEDEIEGRWIRTSEISDVLNSLSHCCEILDLIDKDPLHWKWVIISLHSALQGAMVCHLAGTAQMDHLTKNSAKKWLSWYRGDMPDPHPKLSMANPAELFQRLYDFDHRVEASSGGLLDVTQDEKDAFKALNGLRKDFVHFNPRGWAIEISGMPMILDHIVSVIEKITSDTWPFRHATNDERLQIRENLKLIRAKSIRRASS